MRRKRGTAAIHHGAAAPEQLFFHYTVLRGASSRRAREEPPLKSAPEPQFRSSSIHRRALFRGCDALPPPEGANGFHFGNVDGRREDSALNLSSFMYSASLNRCSTANSNGLF
ncbi:hypothetical protein MTO96_002091 [Rhipicephalus appendiculatus]